MKRSWFGFLLLLVILAIALTVTWVMEEIHRPVSQALREAADLALMNDWNRAADAALRAKSSWQLWANVRLCFADHTPVEEIDSFFGELEAYRIEKETADFAAACLALKEKVDAVGQAHGLSLWNLL